MNREKIKELLNEYATYITYSKYFQANGSTNSVLTKIDVINEAIEYLEYEGDTHYMSLPSAPKEI